MVNSKLNASFYWTGASHPATDRVWFLVGPVNHIRRQSSTLVVSLGHPQPFVSPYIPSVLLPFGSSPYIFPYRLSVRSLGHIKWYQIHSTGTIRFTQQVSSVLNSQVQSKITKAVDSVFGESAFWNPAAKAKTLLLEELKPYIGTKFQYKFLDVGCSKNVQDYLQYLEVCSFHPKEYDAGNGTQRNHHIIDKVRDGCGVTKLKLLAQLQWLHKGGNVNLIFIPPTFPFDPGESSLWTNPFEEEENDVPQIVQSTSCSLPLWTRLVRMNLDSRQRVILTISHGKNRESLTIFNTRSYWKYSLWLSLIFSVNLYIS